jgi:hypothetical protein
MCSAAIAGRANLPGGMIGLRDKPWRRLGALLTGLGVGLQLVLASLGLLIVAATSDPTDAFGGHALCLASESGAAQPARPAEGTPGAPAHQHLGFCCLWHQLPGVQPVAMLPAQPVAFTYVAAAEPGMAAFTPGPRRGPGNARAPPTLA